MVVRPNAMKNLPVLLLLFMLAINRPSSAQIASTRKFVSSEGFCRRTMYLDSSGLFFHEWGCEGRSNVSNGTYSIKGNKIAFSYARLDSLPPVAKVIESRFANTHDSLITITLYDRYGARLGLLFGVLLIDNSGKFIEVMTEENGTIRANPLHYKYLTTRNVIFLSPNSVAVPLCGKSVDIYFNFPEEFLIYPEINVDEHRKFDLKLTPAGLYNYRTKTLLYKNH